jgi:hypothetical protein
MNREEFFAKLAPLDEDRLRKVLWNLYWRGSATVRERIEGELDPVEHARRKQDAAAPPNPGLVLHQVREFAELARSGAYLAGDRRVSPKERTRWRVTFRRLAADAEAALRAPDPAPGAEALALIIDLACEMKGYQYFRSEDPVEAARFVVSDAAALLWETVRDRHGFGAFAEQAAPQLLRWESRYGWTTHGWGQVSGKEISLARVLARMLAAPDAWTTFADCYLGALDQAARADATAPPRIYYGSWGPGDSGYRRGERARNLAEWHGLLLERLAGSEAEDRLGRLASHRALGGPDRMFLQARLARQRGDTAAARTHIADCLRELPGEQDFARFAAEIGTD